VKHERINKVLLGDCLELMKDIPDKSIDMILTDPPYLISKLSWDKTLDLKTFWEQAKRVIKDNGAMVLTAAQPFTTDLINSNRQNFKYVWIWEKSRASDFLRVNYRPMQKHEDVVVFSKGDATARCKNPMVYVPQGLLPCNKKGDRKAGMGLARDRTSQLGEYERKFTNYPTSVLKFGSEGKTLHPTQKPLGLWEYLIKTYTRERDLVLDPFSGSGTTAVACINTNRGYICMEREQKYFDIIRERIYQPFGGIS